jgi:anaerobic glycerol-3-phosphate dehydrogenase
MNENNFFRQIAILGINGLPDLTFKVSAIRPSYITVEFDTGRKKIVICNELTDYTNATVSANVSLITTEETRQFDSISELCKYLKTQNVEILHSSMEIFNTDCIEQWFPQHGSITKRPLRGVFIRLCDALIAHGL